MAFKHVFKTGIIWVPVGGVSWPPDSFSKGIERGVWKYLETGAFTTAHNCL